MEEQVHHVLIGVFTVNANVTPSKSHRCNMKGKICNTVDKRAC